MAVERQIRREQEAELARAEKAKREQEKEAAKAQNALRPPAQSQPSSPLSFTRKLTTVPPAFISPTTEPNAKEIIGQLLGKGRQDFLRTQRSSERTSPKARAQGAKTVYPSAATAVTVIVVPGQNTGGQAQDRQAGPDKAIKLAKLSPRAESEGVVLPKISLSRRMRETLPAIRKGPEPDVNRR